MLRPYQQLFFNQIRDRLKPGVPLLGVAVTSFGKSHVISEICKSAAAKETQVLILAPNKELVAQNQDKYKLGSIYCAGLNEKEVSLITFGTIGSVFNAKEQFKNVGLIIVDEAHGVSPKSKGRYRELIDYIGAPYVLGVTATPFRLKAGGNYSIVGEDMFFEDCVLGAGITELQGLGYLSPLISKGSAYHVEEARIAVKSTGDFEINSMFAEFSRIQKEALLETVELTKDRDKLLVFCSGVQHSKAIAKALNDLGVSAVSVTGDTQDLFRASAIADFKSGKIKALCNAEIFTTGFDVPDIDSIAMFRATKSLALLHQICGRGMRIADGKKDCLVLDYGNNFKRHGTLENYTLQKLGTGSIDLIVGPEKECPECFEYCHTALRTCPSCGYDFPKKEVLGDAYEDGIVQDKPAEPEEHPVLSVDYHLHSAKSGRTCIKAFYYVSAFDKKTEWVSLPDFDDLESQKEGFVYGKMAEWFEERGLKIDDAFPPIVGVDEAFTALESISHPSSIMVTKEASGFDRIAVLELGCQDITLPDGSKITGKEHVPPEAEDIDWGGDDLNF